MKLPITMITVPLAIMGLSLISLPTLAYEKGDWLVRGRIVNVNPQDDSGEVTGLAGSGVKVDDAYTLDIDITYVFNRRVSAELLLNTTSAHDVSGNGSLSSLGKIIDSRVLPPSLLLQYHPLPLNNIDWYVGFGINYSLFLEEDASSSLEGALGGKTSVDIDSSWGWVAQIGADFDIGNDWFFNIDLKYIDLDTTAHLKTAGVKRDVDVDINPLLFGIGFGKRF